MSKHRFTMDELNRMSDIQILEILVNERRNDLTNPYTPFAERLAKISSRLSNGQVVIKH